MLSEMQEVSDKDADEEYQRSVRDASITIDDLEDALETYFESVEYRNMQTVLDKIDAEKTTCKSDPIQYIFLDLDFIVYHFFLF